MTAENREVAEKAEILILSVKPQFYPEVIAEIRECIKPEQLIITIAPGKTLEWLQEQFGRRVKLVRTMPNTPAMVGEGMTAVCCSEEVTEEELEKVMTVSYTHLWINIRMVLKRCRRCLKMRPTEMKRKEE